ncbi:MAG TPA: heme ABC exporter ATP-binding protein CcmA [Candidatus Limnocylindria bacterium]|nr:heme ABC exporter ATP-binding protein CcmA [Candidatus Limnocylindria bacterium]
MPQTIYVSPRSRGLFDSPPAAVVTRDVARLFGETPALAGVSFGMDAGRVVGLLGPNGAGKTTLLRILATAIRPSWGSVRIDGLDPAVNPIEVRERVAYLSHATALYGDLTARENLVFSATLLGLGGVESRERVAAALAAVDLEGVADRRVRGYSAGMRRRLGLARLLLGSPSLVLLDEPYAALDADAMGFVDRLLVAWRDAGVAVIVASHAADRIAAQADGTLRLEGGVAVEARGGAVRLLDGAPAARPADQPHAVGDGVLTAGASR